jgi:hypothetical protein
MNGPNKQECYIILGWKGSSGANTLAFWSHLYDTKKIKCCEYDSWSLFCSSSFKSIFFLLFFARKEKVWIIKSAKNNIDVVSAATSKKQIKSSRALEEWMKQDKV